MDTGKNYTKEMEKLHQKQFESLPEEKQYKGGHTVDELLQDMAEGKTLDCLLYTSCDCCQIKHSAINKKSISVPIPTISFFHKSIKKV